MGRVLSEINKKLEKPQSLKNPSVRGRPVDFTAPTCIHNVPYIQTYNMEYMYVGLMLMECFKRFGILFLYLDHFRIYGGRYKLGAVSPPSDLRPLLNKTEQAPLTFSHTYYKTDDFILLRRDKSFPSVEDTLGHTSWSLSAQRADSLCSQRIHVRGNDLRN